MALQDQPGNGDPGLVDSAPPDLAVTEFDAFLGRRAAPRAVAGGGPGQVRALMLEFLALCGSRACRGRRAGKPRPPASVLRLAGEVEQFYMFMTDNKEEAAAALGDPRWLRWAPSIPASTGAASSPASAAPR